MDWSKGILKISGFICVAGLFLFVAGCGDDSSGPDTDLGPESSAGSADVASSSAGADSTVPSVNSALFTFATDPRALAVAPDEDGFYDMGDVYKAVPKTSKIAFVIRHSKRQKSTGTESQLTQTGVQMAQDLGKKLASDETFYYASTDFIRTRETCKNIATGRGETGASVVTWDGINGDYFLTVPSDTLDALVSSRGGNPKYIAQYAYGVPYSGAYVAERIPAYFYDLFERGNQFVDEVVVANMSSWKRVSILVSHDMLVEPLVVFVSNRAINLKIYESPFRWVNYLSGIAVIVDEAGAVTVLPVRGDEVGWMIPRDEVDEGT